MEEDTKYNSIVDTFLDQDDTHEICVDTLEEFKRFPIPLDDKYTGWDIGYHVTSLAIDGKIFPEGGLKKISQGAQLAHDQFGSTTRSIIHVFPVLEILVFPTYFDMFLLHPSKKDNADGFVQIVFEVIVNPGYRMQSNNIINRRTH